jgi:hypothetical protein
MGSLEVLGAAQLEFAAPGAKMVIGGTGLTVAGTATVKSAVRPSSLPVATRMGFSL